MNADNLTDEERDYAISILTNYKDSVINMSLIGILDADIPIHIALLKKLEPLIEKRVFSKSKNVGFNGKTETYTISVGPIGQEILKVLRTCDEL